MTTSRKEKEEEKRMISKESVNLSGPDGHLESICLSLKRVVESEMITPACPQLLQFAVASIARSGTIKGKKEK